ncbi:MAG: hypothetical protein QNJ51_07055 [Calothrix sp. MO_167.B12]|nr:hypothetical protein [Calothrix sp. MO_167.B12]
MIAEHHDSTSMEQETQRRIKIKQSQLQIALEGNMPHVARGLKRQLVELQRQIKSPPDSDFQALMSLVDD